MRLDRVAINLRRRSPWEAIDLGLVMLRHWRGPVYRVWLALVLPAALGILAALWAWPMAGALTVWWLKPVADRLLLKVFSEAAFGEAPTLREVWRSIPGLLRHSGLVSRLSLRRFSRYRSFELPVLQLEGQRGKAFRLRKQVLSRKVAGHAVWLICVCVHVVVIFEIGLLQLASLLVPGDALGDDVLFALFFSDNLVMGHVFNVFWLVAESIVEPFYVAAGFSLYLNRRSELEGWDIELAFRHMADTRAGAALAERPPRRQGAKLAAAVLLAGALFALPLPDAAAGEAVPEAESAAMAEEAERVAREVLADPVFGRDFEEMQWQRRVKDDVQREPDDPPGWLRHFQTFAGWLAQGLRGVVYLLMAAALAVLLVILYRHAGRFAGTPPRRAARAPETLFGLDLRPASLPADIAAAAWAEAEAGRVAAALSLLYRGALVALIEAHHVPFRDGDTENVCLRRVSGHAGKAALAYFSVLLEAWKASAYAGSPPPPAALRVLCQEWREHFAGRGGAP
ncbi:MAG: DUF4129 domain-containing protein [Candidatus Accumulibacter sp.]|nr:DUF4129 domain-containing protein [Accumulibacter sp.]